jgi:Flp pilus assembly protein TadD
LASEEPPHYGFHGDPWPTTVNAVQQTCLALPLELRVLLWSAHASPSDAERAEIRRALSDAFDWTAFTRKAMDHGLVSIAGRRLAEIASDIVPAELLDAFQIHAGEIAERNFSLFAELNRLTMALNASGVEIIPLKGPVTAIQAYGNLGARAFRDLDFLVRDADLMPALRVLRGLGYDRQPGLTPAQLSMIHRIQGQEVMTHAAMGLVVEPHTRLTSAKFGLDIDHAGLWRRARPASVNGHTMLTLAPEDHFILLAIHGGKELWWRINWACDIAAFVSAHPHLAWAAILERSRAQGCLRMALLAARLAQLYFGAALPQVVDRAIHTDPVLPSLINRITPRWLADETSGPPPTQFVSKDVLRLHDGWLRRMRYALRTWFLPRPSLIGWVALPERMRFAYVPLKLVHDALLLPCWKPYSFLSASKDVVPNDNVEKLFAQAESLRRFERVDDAIDAYNKVLDIAPNHVEALIKLGHLLIVKMRYKEARRAFWRAVANDTENPASYYGLGSVLRRMGHYDEASAAYNQALTLRPDYADAIAGLGTISLEMGNLADARTAFAKAMSLQPDNVANLYMLAFASEVHKSDPVFANLKDLLAKEPSMPSQSRERLHFALAKAYEETGEREQAFRHQLQGNAIRRARVRYDERAWLTRFEQIRHVFSHALMKSAPKGDNPSRLPIFVVGMPRSGSTLIEQILSSHPQVFGAGERELLAREIERAHKTVGLTYPDAAAISSSLLQNVAGAYIQSVSNLAPEANRIIDKQLGNFMHIGLIHLALPNARIIHAMRDPVDTCLSCFSRLFLEGQSEFTYDLTELGRWYRAYQRLMEHWRTVLPPEVVLDVRYESVVTDLEHESRRILAHCGLEWDSACLAFYESKRSITTSSITQVRRPIYRSSVGRWRPEEQTLRPLLSALAGE